MLNRDGSACHHHKLKCEIAIFILVLWKSESMRIFIGFVQDLEIKEKIVLSESLGIILAPLYFETSLRPSYMDGNYSNSERKQMVAK